MNHPTAITIAVRNAVGRSFGIFSRVLGSVTGASSCCRFEPSCSHYGREAVERFGLVRGSWMAARRVWRCRPGAEWGLDPVPSAIAKGKL